MLRTLVVTGLMSLAAVISGVHPPNTHVRPVYHVCTVVTPFGVYTWSARHCPPNR